MRKTDYASNAVKTTRGPRATVYSCPFCKHHEVVPKGPPGCGRGYGLRTGGGANSRMRAHIRATHPNELAAFTAGYIKQRDIMAAKRAEDMAKAVEYQIRRERTAAEFQARRARS